MACVVVAFIVFKPVINTYANAIAAKLKAAEKAEAVMDSAQSPTRNVKEPKKDKTGTVKRAVRDVEEEIST
jgi:hypothetical protein